MLSRFPFLPGGLALIASACAMPQPGLRRTTPIDHTLLESEQLHTERQIVEERDIQLLTAFGNLTAPGERSFQMKLSAAWDAPIVSGTALHVSRLLQQNQMLIAAYSGPDAKALGALALIDVSDPEAPLLRAELQLPTMAVSAIAWDGSGLVFAGASGPTALLGRVSVQNFEFQDDLGIQSIEMSTVSDLAVLGERIWLLDRHQNLLLAVNKRDGVVSSQLVVPGLERLGRDNVSIWAERATQILQMDSDLHVKTRFPPAGGPTSHSGHGPIRLGQELVMTSLGSSGLRAYCKADQKPLFHVPAVIRAGIDPEKTATRDAALSQGLLLTANADAGVYVYTVKSEDRGNVCKDRSLQLEGYLQLGKGFRVDALNWQQDVLTISDGQGRLNMLYLDRETDAADDVDFDS